MTTKDGSYEFLDHMADVGIQIQAKSRAALFVTAARALMAWIGPPPPAPATHRQDVELKADDLEELLVRWMQELVYQFQHRHFYTTDVTGVRLIRAKLRATLLGKSWDEAAQHNFREVKAVTYHKLRVFRDGGTWRATVILDV